MSVYIWLLLIFVSLWSPWRWVTPLLALAGTASAFAGHFHGLSAGPEGSWVALLLEIDVFWVAALVVMGYRDSRRRVMRQQMRQQISRRQIRERTLRLRTLLDTTVDGIIIIDEKGTVEDYNIACQRLFGYSPEEVIGRNVNMLMPPPYCDEHDGYLEQYRKTGRRKIIGIGREVEGRRQDGTTFPMELSVGEARHGNSPIFMGIIRDITARKQAEADLQKAKEQAEVASRAKSLFLANMSHEIRTPMNAVLGHAELLENAGNLPTKMQQSVASIKRAGTHLMELISDILDISKIEAGAETLEAEDFEISALVEGLSAIFGVRCEQKNLMWRVDTQIDDPLVRGDQRKLRQVLINLVGNAVKFTERGEITLRIVQSGRNYCFEVRDTGPGISAEVQRQIFEPFHQAEEGLHKGGTGLGLAIAKRQIEMMGGHLSLQSIPGQGSLFSFTISLRPAVGPIPLPVKHGSRVERPRSGKRFSTLVVDDVEDNRDILVQMLQSMGAQVAVAGNGKEALLALRAYLPDIIFMDIRMPVMNGLEALRQIRQLWRDRRIICVAVSASGSNDDSTQYVQAGFDDFIAKPLSLAKISGCLERHLGLGFEPAHRDIFSAEEKPRRNKDFSEIKLPEELKRRLRRAVERNAFTDIESILSQVRARDHQARAFADHVQELLGRYDRDGLLSAVEQISHE